MVENIVFFGILQAILSLCVILGSLLNAAMENWDVGRIETYIMRGGVFGLLTSPFGIFITPLAALGCALGLLYLLVRCSAKVAFPKDREIK